MNIIDRLASTLGRKDEGPNQELAQEIVATRDARAVKELVLLLAHKDKAIQSDSIKIIYEVGMQQPALIAGYATDFVALLQHKNNRLQWGAMTALHAIASEQPDVLHAALPQLEAVADAGSVITRDHYVGILIKLLSHKKYSDHAFQLLNEQLQGAPGNQLPMYAEQAALLVPKKHKDGFVQTLQSRLGDFEKESKRKRVEKVLKKLAG